MLHHLLIVLLVYQYPYDIINLIAGAQVVTPSQDVSICEGGTITPLYVQTPGNLDPNISVTYEWFNITDPLNTFSVGSNATILLMMDRKLSPVLSPGVYNYHCVLTFSSAGCSSQTSLPITLLL